MTVNYAEDMLINISDDGMTKNLWDIAKTDNKILSFLNIKNDKERNLYFYLDNFFDDLCEEFKCDNLDKDDTLYKMFIFLRDKENVDLVDIRKALYKSLKYKKAYPNITGDNFYNELPEYNIDKWVNALNSINRAIKKGKSKYIIIKKITEGWDPMEKINFNSWLRYYENKDHEKYDLEKCAEELSLPEIKEDKKEIKQDKIEPRIEHEITRSIKPRAKKTLEESKQSLISRLDSAGRLLREFAYVWPTNIWNRLYESLSDLKREIIPLKTISTINDRIIKTANVWKKQGFSEGADILTKIAQPGDLASEIENALKEHKKTPSAEEMQLPQEMQLHQEMPELPEIGPTAAPTSKDELGEMLPKEELGEMLPKEEGDLIPPKGVEEELPPPIEPKVTEEKVGKPFDDASIKDVLKILEPISRDLQKREFVRQLSKADMMLDTLNMASFFPELGEATSKALELNIYIGTRLNKIIDKLKGSVDKKKEKMPEVEMEEFPESFEVEEELPLPPKM